jgi:hypothetical protein
MTNTTNVIIRPDAKGRITLGIFAKGISSFRMHREKGGRIVLDPYVEIPAREQWLYNNPTAMAALDEGLADLAAGRVVSMGSFAEFANDDLDKD